MNLARGINGMCVVHFGNFVVFGSILAFGGRYVVLAEIDNSFLCSRNY